MNKELEIGRQYIVVTAGNEVVYPLIKVGPNRAIFLRTATGEFVSWEYKVSAYPIISCYSGRYYKDLMTVFNEEILNDENMVGY